VSEKARAEYRELFEATGTDKWLDEIREEEEKPVEFRYSGGRITGE